MILRSARSACSSPAPCRACRGRQRAGVVLLAVGAAFYALLAWRAVRTYTLTRRTTDLLVFVGCVWLGWALVPQLAMGYGTLAFYFGHAMELLGIILVGIPAALDLRQGGPSRPLVGDLTAVGPRRRRGGVPRPARARPDGRPRRQGPLDRGAHPPRGHARVRRRRGAQAATRDAAPPRDRRAAARHGQAARPGGHPLQARRARRGGVRGDQAPPGGRRAAARRPRRLRPRRARPRARPPRAARRRRLPARAATPTGSASPRAC